MLMHLLKNSDWSFLLDFVSPAFFKVIPPMELVNNASALAKRTRDQHLYQTSVQAAAVYLGRFMTDLQVVPGTMTRRGDVPGLVEADVVRIEEHKRVQLATRIVEIYFAQILTRQTVLLDVRLSRFAHTDEGVWWSPAPLMGVFSDSFLNAMSELYQGYYGSNPEQMKKALRELQLDWAHDVFIAHFGEGDQSAVRFTMSHFVQTFHEVFTLCKNKRQSLRGEFVQLGVILGLMYESLEKLNVTVDVRSAFQRVLISSQSSSH